eukprot:581121-Hanusia_phi.AAC.1
MLRLSAHRQTILGAHQLPFLLTVCAVPAAGSTGLLLLLHPPPPPKEVGFHDELADGHAQPQDQLVVNAPDTRRARQGSRVSSLLVTSWSGPGRRRRRPTSATAGQQLRRRWRRVAVRVPGPLRGRTRRRERRRNPARSLPPAHRVRTRARSGGGEGKMEEMEEEEKKKAAGPTMESCILLEKDSKHCLNLPGMASGRGRVAARGQLVFTVELRKSFCWSWASRPPPAKVSRGGGAEQS